MKWNFLSEDDYFRTCRKSGFGIISYLPQKWVLYKNDSTGTVFYGYCLLKENFDKLIERKKKIMTAALSSSRGKARGENIIAQSVACSGNGLYFYAHRSEKTHQNDVEIDFLLTDGSLSSSKVIPIEVKFSRNYTTISYSRFSVSFPKRIGDGYVVHPKQLKIEGKTTYLPCYMFFCLFEGQ